MGPLNKSNDLGVAYPEKSGATGVLHDSELALDFSHLQELSAVHAQGADVVIVPQV
jgi:hypothetical protein